MRIVLNWFRRLTIVCSLVLLMASGVAHAAPSGLQAKITASSPEKPVVTLTNGAATACRVAADAFGTVSILSVQQNGKTITPTAFDVASDDDVIAVLATKLKTLQPGAHIDVPLLVTQAGSHTFVRSVVATSGGGLFGQQYAVAKSGALSVQLNYDAPIVAGVGAPLCGLATTASGSSGSLASMGWFKIALLILAVVIVLALIVLLILWLYHRKHRSVHHVVVAVLLGLSLVTWLAPVPHAHADYVVPPDAQSEFDTCMGVLNAHRDITGPVLDALADQHITITPNHSQFNDAAAIADIAGGGFEIRWDAYDTYTYSGGEITEPCERLYHEMYHIYEMLNGTFNRDDCAGSGIETKEVMATRAQNVLRAALGLPPREHYGTTPLPSGNCDGSDTPPPCVPGQVCAQSNGDPHLITFDGLRYDFMAAGEFWAARDISDKDFAVQVRQEPWVGSRQVSLTSAVALQVAKDKVEVGLRNNVFILHINGKARTLQTIKLDGGGTVITLAGTVTVAWPDGSQINIASVGGYGLRFALSPAAAHAGKLEGIFGNDNAKNDDDLMARGSSAVVKPTFDALYPKYADSWRVNDATALFSYTAGTNTATYTDKSFPDKPIDVANLSGHDAAEIQCKSAGVTDSQSLQDCIVDVALTGRPEFAQAAMRGQTSVTQKASNSWQVTIANPGDTASVDFSGVAGQKIFVDVPTTTIPDRCGALQLKGPDGGEITSGCIIGHNGYIDGTVLPTTGAYHIAVVPNDTIGAATINLYTIHDQHGAVAPDGVAFAASINRPGEVSYATFNATEGQYVFVNIPGATVASQCGGVRIMQPDGSMLSDGCIINNKGNIDTKRIPVTGTYTVVVDPNDRIIGQASVQVIFADAQAATVDAHHSTTQITLAKPGSFATFSFAGVAGQKLFATIPKSTLLDQCGVLSLVAPDGSGVDSGCIIAHKGGLEDGGFVLPQSGTYKLVLNPDDDITGSATLNLHD